MVWWLKVLALTLESAGGRVLPFTSWVTLDKLLYLSESQFHPLLNGYSDSKNIIEMS